MKIFTVLYLLIIFHFGARSQSCTIPQPLSSEQKNMVNGAWFGSYEMGGVSTSFSVLIDFNINETIEITHPPLEGNKINEEYRFCGAGAFHFKIETDNGYYEFDGVPNKTKLEGTLVVVTNKGQQSGKFSLAK